MSMKDGSRYSPSVDRSLCSSCGLCLKTCPGMQITSRDNSKTALDALGEIGEDTECSVGYSMNPHTRFESASGGLVTELATYMLENGIVDGVVATRMRRDRPLETEVILAKTRSEIWTCAGSKYCPVCPNQSMKEFLKDRTMRIAFIGLPCHISGLNNILREMPDLNDRIVLKIGIFCGGCPSAQYTKFLLRSRGVSLRDVTSIQYRGQGWPGTFRANLLDGGIVDIPFQDSYSFTLKSFFLPLRCRICLDLFANEADISFGDAWLPEILERDHKGTSVVISRSSKAEEVLTRMVHEKKIHLDRIDVSKIVESQKYYTYKLSSRSAAIRLLELNSPGVHLPNTMLRGRIRVSQYCLFYVLHLLGSTYRTRGQYHAVRLVAYIIESGKRIQSRFRRARIPLNPQTRK